MTATVELISTPGLGDNSYLLVDGGSAILVDPQRDVPRFMDALERHGANLHGVIETHLHNDYVSGGRTIAQMAGVDVILPAGSGAAYLHRPAFHLEDISVGQFLIRPLHTPGHTPEHVSYMILVDDLPWAVFSGGSLLVGAVGRTDLLGMDRARTLARAQHASITRLAGLPDEVALYPTHGAGSFCSASMAGSATSTIGEERLTNPALAHQSAEEFADTQLAGLQPYPRYYSHIGPINLKGPPAPPTTEPSLLSIDELLAAIAAGAEVVDARPKQAFAEGHIPGSWGVEANTDFVTWVGWLLEFNQPIVIVIDEGDDPKELASSLSRIGFDTVVGYVIGTGSWTDSNRPLVNHGTITARGLVALPDDTQILDVRAPDEWETGHLTGSIHRYLPDLAEDIPTELDRSRPVYVGCATGHRASAAAGILSEHGYEPVVVVGASILGAITLAESQT